MTTEDQYVATFIRFAEYAFEPADGRNVSLTKIMATHHRWAEETGEQHIPAHVFRSLLERVGINVFPTPYGDKFQGIDVSLPAYNRYLSKRAAR
jgi:hypothetical protein